MKLRYTKHFLNKLEDIFSESDYFLRYEKGNFRSGYCIIKDKKVVVVNKYYTVEGKINSLINIIKEKIINPTTLSDKNKLLYQSVLHHENTIKIL